MKKTLVLLALAGALAAPAPAIETTPLQIGIWGPSAQLFPASTRVMGLRLNLVMSANDEVMGFDLGLVGRADRMSAIQVNLANWVETEFAGV
ncbi:MAG TPA: hypothetical protein PKX16_09670, partial [Kiritimatiellia bacterium]|nr:hypothetical protein [Kiritimatiellia bacterium]